MKEVFAGKRFSPESGAILVDIEAILQRYSDQGYDLSLRQLYYQLVAADQLPKKWADPKTGSTNNEKSYKNIGSLVSDARLAGLIDWDMIEDRGRGMVRLAHWESPADIVEIAARQFRIDKWLNQPVYVEVMVEKQALEGVLVPVCETLDVPFTANKGYSSSSALYKAGQRLREKLRADKEIHIIYLGDHDPSGIDMSRDVADRLIQFARADTSGSGTVHLHRVALNMDQIDELDPPENPAKLTDSRAQGYIARFGESSWELDAIEPSALAELVRRAVHDLLDVDQWGVDSAREAKMRANLLKFSKTYKSPKN